MADGKDVRSERLTDRKQELRRLLAGMIPMSRFRYADHIEREGIALFKRVCEMDLEGIVAKHAFGPYTAETKWFKIKNRIATVRCRAAKNYLSANDIRSL